MALKEKIVKICAGIGLIVCFTQGTYYTLGRINLATMEVGKSREYAVSYAKEELHNTGKLKSTRIIFYGYRKACEHYLKNKDTFKNLEEKVFIEEESLK